MAAFPTAADPRWPRILARDRTADGAFYYSVATTGVYCRPSCPSRAANPANVTIHDSLADARATGARPCRRCDPEGDAAAATAASIAHACRTIETAERTPALADLAASAGLSPGHFHRLFKAATGLTPRGYAAAHRAARVRDELRDRRHRHASDLRRRLRLERPLLRRIAGPARHAPDPLPCRRHRRDAALRHRPGVARRDPRRIERRPASPRSCSATIPPICCATSRIASPPPR